MQEWQQAGRLLMPQQQQEGVLFAMLLELSSVGVITVGRPAADVGRLAAYLLIAGPLFRMWGPDKEAVGRVREEVRSRLGLAIGEAPEVPGPIQFHDVITEALVFPTKLRDANATAKVVEHAQRYYEETWIHQPRRSLAGTAPIDAGGHTNLRKKLRGVVKFIQDCAAGSLMAGYDFDRLRRKLGLAASGGRQPPDEAMNQGADAPRSPATDIGAMSAAELAGLKAESLNDEQLEQAFQAAVKLDAEDLAAAFALALTSSTAAAGADGSVSVVLVPDAARAEERPAGRGAGPRQRGRAGGLRSERGPSPQRLRTAPGSGPREARRGRRGGGRVPAFDRAGARRTEVSRQRGGGDAVAKAGGAALKFAEDGLAVARQRGDRDTEHYLQELAGAAKRQMG